jgi:hypothetical protein
MVVERHAPREEGRQLLDALADFGPVLAVKLYRLPRTIAPDVPIIPCLDHEAMLHEHVDAHAAAYVQERSSGDMHEIVFIPSAQRLEIDRLSTWGEHSADSEARLIRMLRTRFPGHSLRVKGPSRWRGERRVAEACVAQVTLREVLLSSDIVSVKAGIERLQAVAGLMEKQSRVSSWGVRTLTGPLLAAAGVVTFLALGRFEASLGDLTITWLRYSIVGALGAAFLYYGLKAVQLTEMSNRVWKRTAEYNLILAERKRLGR